VEYLAFGLLGIGGVLILAGILSGISSQKNIYTPTENQTSTQTVTDKEPAKSLPEIPIFTETPPDKPAHPSIQMHVSRQNPSLFVKEAYLYLDYSANNIYDGKQNNFQISDTTNIRRLGLGSFSYDGFAFYFQHQSSIEKFPVPEIQHVAFYPNCMAIVYGPKKPTAIFFVDNTNKIRNILDTFRVENVS
jgi:hypothetical protein